MLEYPKLEVFHQQVSQAVSKTSLFETTILFLDAVSITELPGNVTSAFASALGACGCEWKVHDWQANSASQNIPP
jgi:hypothetical protein